MDRLVLMRMKPTFLALALLLPPHIIAAQDPGGTGVPLSPPAGYRVEGPCVTPECKKLVANFLPNSTSSETQTIVNSVSRLKGSVRIVNESGQEVAVCHLVGTKISACRLQPRHSLTELIQILTRRQQ